MGQVVSDIQPPPPSNTNHQHFVHGPQLPLNYHPQPQDNSKTRPSSATRSQRSMLRFVGGQYVRYPADKSYFFDKLHKKAFSYNLAKEIEDLHCCELVIEDYDEVDGVDEVAVVRYYNVDEVVGNMEEHWKFVKACILLIIQNPRKLWYKTSASMAGLYLTQKEPSGKRYEIDSGKRKPLRRWYSSDQEQSHLDL